MKLHKTLMVSMIIFGILADSGLQQTESSTAKTSPTPTPESSIGNSKPVIIGVTILCIVVALSVCGLTILWRKYIKRRKTRGNTPRINSTYSAYSMYSSNSADNTNDKVNYYILYEKSVIKHPNNEIGTRHISINDTPQQKYNWNQPEIPFVNPPSNLNNFDNNDSPGEEIKVVEESGSELKKQDTNNFDNENSPEEEIKIAEESGSELKDQDTNNFDNNNSPVEEIKIVEESGSELKNQDTNNFDNNNSLGEEIKIVKESGSELKNQDMNYKALTEQLPTLVQLENDSTDAKDNSIHQKVVKKLKPLIKFIDFKRIKREILTDNFNSPEEENKIVKESGSELKNQDTNNFDNNNSPEEKNKIEESGSKLKNQTLGDSDILSAPILKEKGNEVSRRGEPIYDKDVLSTLKNNVICQETNHVSDDSTIIGTHCTLSTTQSCEQPFSSEMIQLSEKDLSDLILLSDAPRYLSDNTLTELYIDKLAVAGQGTVGLKFQAREGFRIVISSNTDQSYGKTNVVVLDIGEKVTYFRKCNNENLDDVLAFTSERNALLDKDIEQQYWFSLDKKNRRLRYGKGPMQNLLAVFCYDFPSQSSEEFDEYAWIEDLRYVAISKTISQNKDVVEYQDKPRVELLSYNLPVTMDLPPLIIKHEDATLEELEAGNATVIDNLPKECRELYWNVAGSKISLNSPEFPDFADAIEYSINTPGLICYERLKEKANGFGGNNPKKTYLRITLGEDRGNSPGVPYVLEVWPSGHFSPIHGHSNSFGIIKILYNEILARYFTDLQPKNQKHYYEKTFKEGQITWISDKFYQTHQLWNRTRKMCVTIQCYQYGNKNQEHYEYFDYIDNTNLRHFKPNSDWSFADFKRLIKREWDRNKYLSVTSVSENSNLLSVPDGASNQLDKRLTY